MFYISDSLFKNKSGIWEYQSVDEKYSNSNLYSSNDLGVVGKHADVASHDLSTISKFLYSINSFWALLSVKSSVDESTNRAIRAADVMGVLKREFDSIKNSKALQRDLLVRFQAFLQYVTSKFFKDINVTNPVYPIEVRFHLIGGSSDITGKLLGYCLGRVNPSKYKCVVSSGEFKKSNSVHLNEDAYFKYLTTKKNPKSEEDARSLVKRDAQWIEQAIKSGSFSKKAMTKAKPAAAQFLTDLFDFFKQTPNPWDGFIIDVVVDDFITTGISLKEATKFIGNDYNQVYALAFFKRSASHASDTSSSELKKLAMSRGINVTGKSVAQLEQSIAESIWAEEHPSEEMPPQIAPMLLHDITSKGKEYVDANFKDAEWLLQEKLNGMRFILALYPDGHTKMTSRAKSSKTFRFNELDGHVLGLMNLKSPYNDGITILDGELIMTNPHIKLPSGVETQSTLQSTVALMHLNAKQSIEVQRQYGSLTYKVFDIVKLNGEDVSQKGYEERQGLVDLTVTAIKELNPQCTIESVPTISKYSSAWDTFREYVSKGAEGLILKARKAPYEFGKRTKNQWKLKQFVDVDVFVSGWVPSSKGKSNENYIGGFKFSTNYQGRVIEIAAITNIDDATRKDATSYDSNGVPTLNTAWLNKCASVIGQAFERGSMRLRSARINEWRSDKNPEDCQLLPEQVKYDDSVSDSVKTLKMVNLKKIIDKSLSKSIFSRFCRN